MTLPRWCWLNRVMPTTLIKGAPPWIHNNPGCAQRRDQTGKTSTDRGCKGTKTRLLTDGNGVALTLHTSATNRCEY